MINSKKKKEYNGSKLLKEKESWIVFQSESGRHMAIDSYFYVKQIFLFAKKWNV